MKTFVVHYARLAYRKAFLVSQFARLGLDDVTYIEQYDRDTLSESDIAMFHPKLSRANMAVTLSHLQCIKDMLASGVDHALILEDDAVLHPDFNARLDKYMNELPDDWDVMFIGNGCGLHIPRAIIEANPGQTVFPKGHDTTVGAGCTRCTDSYVLRRRCAERILDYVSSLQSKVEMPVDWWYNDVLRDIGAKVYWSEPTIVEQATQNGMWPTSVQVYQ